MCVCVYRWLYLDIENYTTVVDFLMNLYGCRIFFRFPMYHRIIASYLCNKFSYGTMKHLHPSQVLFRQAKRGDAGIKLLHQAANCKHTNQNIKKKKKRKWRKVRAGTS